MRLGAIIQKNRRVILVALSMFALGVAATAFALVPGGRLAFGLGIIGTLWELHREFSTPAKKL